MTQETDNEKRVSILRKVFRVLFWPVRRWRNVFITFVVLGLAYTATIQVLRSKLDALLEASRAKGEATSLSEYQLKDLSDDKNAAVVYRYAYSLFHMPDGGNLDKNNIWSRYTASKTSEAQQVSSQAQGEEPANGPLTPEEEAMVEAYIASNKSAYDAICEASAKPACQFGDYSDASKVIADAGFFMGGSASIRPLIRAISLRAVWEARHGNTEAAYEWIQRGFHLANNLRNDPVINYGLMQMIVVGLMQSPLETIMCETPWSGKLPAGLEQELSQLQDRRTVARFFEGERCFESESPAFPLVKRSWMLPMHLTSYAVQSDFIAAVRELDIKKRQALIAEVERDVFPAGLEAERDRMPHMNPLAMLFPFSNSKMLIQLMFPAHLNAAKAFDRMEAQVLINRQALALKRYKQAQGQYPDRLQQLVSAGIESLPLDPFNGEPFCYKKEGEGFRLYSVGPNLADDGGIPLTPYKEAPQDRSAIRSEEKKETPQKRSAVHSGEKNSSLHIKYDGDIVFRVTQ